MCVISTFIFIESLSLTEFDPLFALFTKSRYADKYVLKANLTQYGAIMENMNADDAGVHDENWRVSNPCDFDFLFYGVRTGMLCLMHAPCVFYSMFHHRRNIVLH